MEEFQKPTTYRNNSDSFMPNGWTHQALNHHQDRSINLAKQALNWRRGFFIMALITSISVSGMGYLATRSSLIPYVIEVDATGSARAINIAEQKKYIPNEKEIKYFLRQFVLNTRTIPMDKVVFKNNWLEAYMFLGKSATTKMNEHMKKENIVERLGTETSIISVNSILSVADSSNTYQIRWTESIYGKDGSKKSTYGMSGIFSIEVAIPQDEKVLTINPLGIIIKDFSYSKEGE